MKWYFKRIANCIGEIGLSETAKPLVRLSYSYPVETFQTNVMGTVNIFEACRRTSSIKAVINITSDKCYEIREWAWGYRENDPMGVYDPYSALKFILAYDRGQGNYTELRKKIFSGMTPMVSLLRRIP